MLYEVVESKHEPGDWRVEAIDHESEGECYVTAFYGLDAEARAKEYAAWMNAKTAKEAKAHPSGAR